VGGVRADALREERERMERGVRESRLSERACFA